jgi:hypothetical protein
LNTSKIFNKFVNPNKLFVLIVTVFSGFLPYRTLLQGELIGYPANQWAWVIYNHWFKFFSREERLRDVNIFYPFSEDLGFTDGFLTQGILYSIFRSIINSNEIVLALVNISMNLTLSFALMYISKLLFKSNLTRMIYIFTVMNSYSLIYTFGGAQGSGYALIAWILILLQKSFSKQTKSQYQKYYFALGLIMIPLSALTVWYGVFFFITIGSLIIFLYFLSNENSLKIGYFLNHIKVFIKSFVVRLSLILSIALWALWCYIYIPVKDLPKRSWNEVVDFLPNFIDFFNTSGMGSNPLDFITIVFSNKGQNNDGFTFFLFTFAVILLLVFRSRNMKTQIWNIEKSIMISAIIWYLTIVLFKDDWAIYKIFWEIIPGVKSIRDPHRPILFYSIFLIGLFYRLCELYLIKKRNVPSKLLIFTMISIVVVEQYRDEIPSFKINDYLISNKSYLGLDYSNCGSVTVFREGSGWWRDQIDGMVLGSVLGIPTTNGYSGGLPPGYPEIDDKYPNAFSNYITWLVENKIVDSSCILDKYGLQEINSKNYYQTLDIIEGIDLTEKFDKVTWNWIINQDASFNVSYFGQNPTSKYLTFELENPECLVNQDLDLHIGDEFIQNIKFKKSQNFEIPVSIQSGESVNVKLMNLKSSCNSKLDSRELFVKLKYVRII